jgi:uncharacterized protein (TIGR03066 family)
MNRGFFVFWSHVHAWQPAADRSCWGQFLPVLQTKGDAMRAILCGTLAMLVFGLTLSADDKKDEKIDPKKLIGKWSPKGKKDDVAIEFLKDGKMTLDSTLKEKIKADGTYKLDGAKLTVTFKVMDMERVRVLIITKLTDTELVTTDEEGKKEETLVRIKDK